MARQSRRDKQQPAAATEQTKARFQTAVYARLSIEDNGIGGDSIENQIELIQQYIDKMPDLEKAGTFIDNGLTGTSFERPGFNRMLDCIRRGSINCIAVKDLSRFGRNYLETGRYLETIFPDLGVRFISVNDSYDSLHPGSRDSLIVPLKSILHDTYAKDISKKVSTAIDIKKKSGRFMGKMPPYGYRRDKTDRHRLVIHPAQAEIVKRIFQWRLEGIGVSAIAHRLNDGEVPAMSRSRWLEGYKDGKENALWHGSAVLGILKNPCYIGCTVERKSSAALYKGGKKVLIPEEEWRLIENTHEPIVDQETFRKVRGLIQESARQRKSRLLINSQRRRRENILAGMVRCGICGGSMKRDGGYFRKDGTPVHYRYYCGNKYLKTGGCHAGTLDEGILLHCVYQACKKQIGLLVNRSGCPAGEKHKRSSIPQPFGEAQNWTEKLPELTTAGGLTKEACAVMIEKVVVNGDIITIHFNFASELLGVCCPTREALYE